MKLSEKMEDGEGLGMETLPEPEHVAEVIGKKGVAVSAEA